MQNLQIQKIKLPADEFARYKKLAAEKAAIDREQKNIVAAWEKAGLLPNKTAENVGVQFVIVNGNNDEIGKVTVYSAEEKVVAAFVARRIS